MELVKLTIDGKAVQAEKGVLLIEAARHRDSGVLLLRGVHTSGGLPNVPGRSGEDS
jgi:hypothetical protein